MLQSQYSDGCPVVAKSNGSCGACTSGFGRLEKESGDDGSIAALKWFMQALTGWLMSYIVLILEY